MGLRCRRGLGRSFWFDSLFWGFGVSVLGLGYMVWLFVFDMGYCRYDNDLGIGMGLAFLIAWAFDGGLHVFVLGPMNRLRKAVL